MKFLQTLLFLTLALGAPAYPSVQLIPQPRELTQMTGVFSFSEPLALLTGNLENTGAADLAAVIESLTGKTPVNKAVGKIRVIELRKVRSLTFPKCADQGYTLIVSPDRIEILAMDEAGIFYGVQTLTQLLYTGLKDNALPCLKIRDWPDFPVRGWQDDISRGPIPTLEYLKKQVRTLAAFKLNAMTLYTEHVFKLKKHPTLAPPDGITQEEIAELSAYAARYHVQVIGNFQSFGHMEKILSKPGYAHLAEKGHILTPTREESYRFLSEVYSEIVPSYSSPWFNINCDETFGLGEDASRGMADSIGIAGIYGYHINRINQLLKPYGKKILMWGDIAADPQITALLPKDITVISWGYHDAPSFEYAIKPFADQKLNFWVAPGTSCWGNIYPNLEVARKNIRQYILDGSRMGASGVLNTTWDDDGHTLFENNWWPLAYGADLSWNPGNRSVSDIKEKRREPEEVIIVRWPTPEAEKTVIQPTAFDKIFFGTTNTSVLSWMNAFSSLHQGSVRGMLTDGRLFEPVMLFYPEYVSVQEGIQNAAVLSRIDSLEKELRRMDKDVVRNRETLDYLKFALAEARFSAEKNLFRIDLNRYIHSPKEALPAEMIKKSIKWLHREAENLKEGYIRLWNLENRVWWLDRNLAAWDRLINEFSEIRGITVAEIEPAASEMGREIRLRSALDNLPVYYTLDGSEPTVNSNRYEEPLCFTSDIKIKARVIAEGRIFPVMTDSLIAHKAVGRLLRLNSEWSSYHPSYDAGGVLGLIDGRTGNVSDLRSGRWQGYSGQDINIEIDLGKPENLHSFSMTCYQNTFSWVILPPRVEVYRSDDGVTYERIRVITHQVPVNAPGSLTHPFTADLTGITTRYLKVIAVWFGPLPEFHASKGQPSMLFADEIILH